MNVLVHKVFYVTETHYIVRHCGPLMGAKEHVLTKEAKHGPYETADEAKEQISSLFRKYKEQGYEETSSASLRIRQDEWREIAIHFVVDPVIVSETVVPN